MNKMNTGNTITALALLLLTACAGQMPRVLDVIELAPPSHVSYRVVGDSVIVQWQASIHEQEASFLGYAVYAARKSLILAPLQALPQPIAVDKQTHHLTLARSTLPRQAFIHVRSTNRRGHLSLPSLPELVIGD